MGGERDEVEDPVDVELIETRVAKTLRRAAADEALGAGAGVDARRLDPDEAGVPALSGRDADQGDELCVARPVTGVRCAMG